MRQILLALAIILSLTSTVFAAGPINPTVGATATLPQANVDGSNLTDLKLLRVCVGTDLTAPPYTNCGTTLSPNLDPPAGATLTVPMSAFVLSADGQYYAEAEAEDTAGNKSSRSTPRVPFEINRIPPATPSLIIQ